MLEGGDNDLEYEEICNF